MDHQCEIQFFEISTIINNTVSLRMLLMLSDNFVLKGQDLISNELGRGGRG